jgi:hypothetical protein
MKKIILMLLAVTALTACSKFEQVPTDENVPVELYGEIYTGASTRGDGVITGIPDAGLKFDLYRANQNPNYSAYTLKVEGTLAKADGKITTNPKLYYLGENNKSSFIGLHPVGGTLANNTVTYDLDGSDDILATESVEGNKVTPPNKALQFQHLLTKIQVDIKVGKTVGGIPPADIVTNLGKVTAIKVVDKAVKAVVTLPNLSDDPTNAADVRPTIDGGAALGDGLLSLWADDGKAIDDATTGGGVALTTDGSVTTIGYAMFLPTTGALQLKISTEESDPNQYVVNIPSYTYAQGYGYIITLRLTEDGTGLIEFNLENVTASIKPWQVGTNGGEIVY